MDTQYDLDFRCSHDELLDTLEETGKILIRMCEAQADLGLLSSHIGRKSEPFNKIYTRGGRKISGHFSHAPVFPHATTYT